MDYRKIDYLRNETDRWINHHLSVFDFDEDKEMYIKINSELIFNVIFTNEASAGVRKKIIEFINWFELEESIKQKERYLQTQLLIEIYKKENFIDYMKKTSKRVFNIEKDLAYLEMRCYENLIENNLDHEIIDDFYKTYVYKDIFSKIPDLTDSYLYTHCIFYITYLNKIKLDNYISKKIIKKLEDYTRVLLGAVIAEDNCDLIAELLICLKLMSKEDESINDELVDLGQNRLIEYVKMFKNSSVEEIELYHTFLAINIFSKVC